jgi:hypothetical protein
MANINVKQRLERLTTELDQVVKHVLQYSGVDKKDAFLIDSMATSLVTQGARLAEEARKAQGVRTTGHSLEKKVRKALGFTFP